MFMEILPLVLERHSRLCNSTSSLLANILRAPSGGDLFIVLSTSHVALSMSPLLNLCIAVMRSPEIRQQTMFILEIINDHNAITKLRLGMGRDPTQATETCYVVRVPSFSQSSSFD